MDADSSRIQDDLRGVVAGDVLCDPLHAQLYASDASIYEMRPVGVVRPRSASDVAACVRYAVENGLSIHARGAGSGLAGESLGRGLVVDFSRYMRRLVQVDDRTVRVQPGLVLAELNRELAPRGRLYGPDPATRSVTTMGSVLALDASGSHWPRYGSARGTVVALQAVTADGRVVEFQGENPGNQHFSRAVTEIAQRYAGPLANYRCRAKVNRGGYRLDLAVRDSGVDLAQLVVGSEGTLALITEATVRTHPVPVCRGVAILFFDRLDQAARGAIHASQAGVAACDLLDRRLLEIARETDMRYERLLPRRAEAMLLVEIAGDSTNELRDRLRALVAHLRDDLRLAFEARQTTEPRERDFYWRLCRRVIPRLYRLAGSTRPLPFIEDVAVDPADLPEFLAELQGLLKSEQVTASVFAHAGHGQVHIRPFLDLADPRDTRRMRSLAERLYETVLRFEGSTNGEHGAGLSRSWVLPRQYGALWPAMVEIKQAFDPANRLNPGKVVSGDDVWEPENYLRPVRPVVEVVRAADEEVPNTPGALAGDAESQAPPRLPVLVDWSDDGGIDRAARMCNGCARCRTTAPEQRMCPMFRIAPREEASPRAKANIIRGVLAGRLGPEALVSSDAREVADLCFQCHQCRLECPASVNIPKLVAEMKGQHVAANGLRISDWWPTRLDLIAPLLARLGPLRRWVLESRRWRWVLQWAVGLAAARGLPRVHHRSFLRWAARRRLNRPVRQAGRKVVFFVDHFVNWHDHQLGRALVEVMRHNQIGIYVPGGQSQSWMPKITAGDLKGARRGAKKNVRLLAEAVRQGYQIVCTEPTAALCLKLEYLNLLDDEDARLVAENTHEACRYLWDLHRKNELALDFRPIPARIAYHQPCHVRAIDSGRPATQLLGLIPGMTVRPVEKGCSGMAGTYGLKRENYRNSLRIGWGLISAMRGEEVQAASTECSACRMQIEHGSGRTTLHPIKLLAYAYGRLPELADNLPPQN